jgi:ABC-type uncharacterized transport system ATPase subunit
VEPVLEIVDLRKVYGHVIAVDAVSLTVARGEVFGVLGPNGAGKTTTVECAAGLRRPLPAGAPRGGCAGPADGSGTTLAADPLVDLRRHSRADRR